MTSPLNSRFSQAAGSSRHKADDIFQHGDCLKKVDKQFLFLRHSLVQLEFLEVFLHLVLTQQQRFKI